MITLAGEDWGGGGDCQCAMRAAGYGETLISKLTSGNWLRVLEETGGDAQRLRAT